MSYWIREVTQAVLLAAKLRPYEGIYDTDCRNTLIEVLDKNTNQSRDVFQAMTDDVLAGTGAVLGFLHLGRIRTDQQLRDMSADDQRNTLIVEVAGLAEHTIPALQKMKNMDIVLAGLGRARHFIRGVLLEGGFRQWREIQKMSHDDQRNTLIVELAGRSNQPREHFSKMDDETLAGAGAVLVFLREAKLRTDQELMKMSDEDQRNTVIVVAQKHNAQNPSSQKSLQLVIEEIHGYQAPPR